SGRLAVTGRGELVGLGPGDAVVPGHRLGIGQIDGRGRPGASGRRDTTAVTRADRAVPALTVAWTTVAGLAVTAGTARAVSVLRQGIRHLPGRGVAVRRQRTLRSGGGRSVAVRPVTRGRVVVHAVVAARAAARPRRHDRRDRPDDRRPVTARRRSAGAEAL